MKRYLIPSLLLAASVAGLSSCDKDSDYTKAIVVYTHNIAEGGCGYLLKLEGSNSLLNPSNLGSNFTQDSLRVLVKYNTLGTYSVCDDDTSGTSLTLEDVEIDEIKRNLNDD